MTTGELLDCFPGLRALVIGDICLDRWCTYDPAVSEPSRETGIPRIGVISTEVTPGAGGTVANNLAALGVGHVAVLGVIGDDGFGYELRRALTARGIDSDFCVVAPGVPTFTYTKLLNAQTGIEDQPRVDFILTSPLPDAIETQVVDGFLQSAGLADVILVSDQAETGAGGVITVRIRDAIAQFASTNPGKVVWVDSRMRLELFRGITAKVNEREAIEASQRVCGEVNYQRLREQIGAPLMMITNGPKEVLVVEPACETWVHARPVENPVDICGAGDSFSAGAALALAITRDPVAAAHFGNLVASVTIMKKGTGTASAAEVLEAAAF